MCATSVTITTASALICGISFNECLTYIEILVGMSLGYTIFELGGIITIMASRIFEKDNDDGRVCTNVIE